MKKKNKSEHNINDDRSKKKIFNLKECNIFHKKGKVESDDMKKNSKKNKFSKIRDKILIILMVGLISVFSLIVVFCIYIIKTAPDISEKKLYKNNSTVLLDKDGKEFRRLGTENREKVTYDELPEVLIDAIIATEDSRFFQHDGVDIARFTKAVFGQLLGRSNAGGGSTLTMQVSKNAATSNVSSGIKGIIRKFTDIYVSIFKLEKRYTKEQIMEFYVNIPGLGAGSFGVEQASKIYFGKSVKDLNLAEAAMIAGLFQAPSAYNPYVNPEKAESRRNQVLYLMNRHGYITDEERDIAKSVPISSMLSNKGNLNNDYLGFIDTVVEEVIQRTGDDPALVSMIIHTTLDQSRQKVINDINNGVTYKWKNNYAQTGIAVVDVKTGALVAVGAGRNKTIERGFNYATSARRHPGSTAKPVLDYGPAIEYLNWGTGQMIIDDVYKYSSGQSIKNFDNKHKGIMTIKKALAQSRNIPALFTFKQTTNQQKLDFATALGWKPETSNGNILESCSIGGFEGVTPLEAAAAFATFARGGTYIEPHTFTKIEYQDRDEVYEPKFKKVQAMSPETAYLINMILKYAVTSGAIGAGSVSGTDVAAKTGTSTVEAWVKKKYGIKGNIIGDSWEIAYSPDYAIATWYGYENINKDHYLTGTEGGNARRTITKLLTTKILKKNSTFKKPSGIVTAKIELETDPVELASEFTPKDLTSTEYFKKSAAPKSTSTRFSKLSAPSNITYTSTGIGVNVSWSPAKTPDAINNEYLTNYFNASKIYKNWADKYLEKRLDYNKENFGSFGYNIYVTDLSGKSTFLAFTKNTNYQINIPLQIGSKITVRTSYEKFTDNQSDGITVTVSEAHTVSTETPITTTPSTSTTTERVDTEGTLTILPTRSSCSTLSDFNKLGNSGIEKLNGYFVVKYNDETVTDDSAISYSCELDGEDVNCRDMSDEFEYTITFAVSYNRITRYKSITIKNNC